MITHKNAVIGDIDKLKMWITPWIWFMFLCKTGEFASIFEIVCSYKLQSRTDR